MICENDTLDHCPHGYLLNKGAPKWNRLPGRVSILEAFELQDRQLDVAKDQYVTTPLTSVVSFDLWRFHVSLAAHEEKNYGELIDLWEACPYGCPIDVFDYQGACSHSTFREFIKLLNGQPQTWEEIQTPSSC
ncbi:hypothetical protein N7465_004373 [Penicillium sp. CMV-2018d]|nr:hypothetical protein N7465_004373 [Penicillium sp. CMV-2018d]